MLVGLVNNVLVNLIRDDISIVFFCQFCYEGQFLESKYLAAGIGRIAENKCLGMLLKSGFQLIRIKMEGRRIQGARK